VVRTRKRWQKVRLDRRRGRPGDAAGEEVMRFGVN